MEFHDVEKLLREKNNILILTHCRPDGDTLGCGSALCLALRDMGKTAHMLENPEAHGLFTDYVEGLYAPEGFSPDFIVSVDTATVDLLPQNAMVYSDKIDLAIDHHGSNTGYGKLDCVVPKHAACGELLYYIIRELTPITPDIALRLYVAISTDTGCFVFSNTTAETHHIAGELMEIGCKPAWVNKRHFRTKSMVRLKLESLLIQDMILLDEGKTVFSSITLETIEKLSATEEDLDNISSFLEQISGVENALLLRELRPGEFKVSMRTGGKLNASEVCAQFGGGGHPSAAGGSIKGNFAHAKEVALSAIKTVQNKA